MNAWIGIDRVYLLIGLVVSLQAAMTLRDRSNPRRFISALFWGLFGAVFLFGDLLVTTLGRPVAFRLIGAAVLLIAAIAGSGRLAGGRPKPPDPGVQRASAQRLGNRLFLPALLIPAVTVLLAVALKQAAPGGVPLLDPKQVTLCALALAAVVALLVAWQVTGGTPLQAVRESRRLLDAIGWAAILPQMLAMLGGVFLAAHTGDAVQRLVAQFAAPDNRLLLVLLYGVGMTLFTMVMGNAFAAFPVMSAGIAMPFLVMGQHADPAPLLTTGMLAGYCGTLMTPMAANFNIVPAALLELRDRHQVIRTQIPTALPLWVINLVLMYLFAFR